MMAENEEKQTDRMTDEQAQEDQQVQVKAQPAEELVPR